MSNDLNIVLGESWLFYNYEGLQIGARHGASVCIGVHDALYHECLAMFLADSEEAACKRARVAAAAPEMLRILLSMEVNSKDSPNYCASCGSAAGVDGIVRHMTNCILDGFLTSVGLDTTDARRAARTAY
jgi:hypothetical protein